MEMKATPKHIGSRRKSCWWDPIYDPLLGDLAPSDWDFQGSTGPKRAFLSAARLSERKKFGEAYKLSKLTFEECDFQGSFEHRPTLIFDECRFFKCDFAYSSWHFTQFRKCEFVDCSIALAAFTECEFRDCEWERTGVTGHKTMISQTFITSPKALIQSAVSHTNADTKTDKRKHAAYQRYRLEMTKAHLSRSILYSHQVVGDDSTYYESAKLHDIQQARSHIDECFYNLQFGENLRQNISGLAVIYWILELIFLWLVGQINGWGSKLLQPFLLLAISLVSFAFIYSRIFLIDFPWQKSFDITALAGYTNQSDTTQALGLRLAEASQLSISIILYTIFLSTAVSRFSRSR